MGINKTQEIDLPPNTTINAHSVYIVGILQAREDTQRIWKH